MASGKRDREDEGLAEEAERPKMLRGEIDEPSENGSGRGRGRGRSRGGGRGRGRGRPRGETTGYGRHGDSHPVKLDSESGALIIKIMVVVKREHAGAVIGRGGENVSTIRTQSGASIHVHKSDNGTDELLVELTGSQEQLCMAQESILSTVAANDADWANDVGNTPKIRFHILPEMVGCVIGKQGSYIKQINNRSGAFCRVDNQRPGETYQKVQIFGTVPTSIACFNMVMDALSSFRAERSATLQSLSDRGPPPPRYDDYRNPYPMQRYHESGNMYSAPAPIMDPPGYGAGPAIPPAAGQPQMSYVMPGAQPMSSGQPSMVLLQNADGTYTQAQLLNQPGATAPAGTAPQAGQQQMYVVAGGTAAAAAAPYGQQAYAPQAATYAQPASSYAQQPGTYAQQTAYAQPVSAYAQPAAAATYGQPAAGVSGQFVQVLQGVAAAGTEAAAAPVAAQADPNATLLGSSVATTMYAAATPQQDPASTAGRTPQAAAAQVAAAPMYTLSGGAATAPGTAMTAVSVAGASPYGTMPAQQPAVQQSVGQQQPQQQQQQPQHYGVPAAGPGAAGTGR